VAKINMLVGNGVDTQFDLNAGFPTPSACVVCRDAITEIKVIGFQFQRSVPDAASVRVTLDPAPATNSVRVYVSDGTELPG